MTCEYLREFSKKFEMIPMRYSKARGTLIYEKNLKSKILCQTPFLRLLSGFHKRTLPSPVLFYKPPSGLLPEPFLALGFGSLSCPALWPAVRLHSCSPSPCTAAFLSRCSRVSLLPTPGHLNSDLAACSYSLERSGAGKPVFLVRDR